MTLNQWALVAINALAWAGALWLLIALLVRVRKGRTKVAAAQAQAPYTRANFLRDMFDPAVSTEEIRRKCATGKLWRMRADNRQIARFHGISIALNDDLDRFKNEGD